MSCTENLTFRVCGWSAWTETPREPGAWNGWAGTAGDADRTACLPPADLPMMLRRRASPLGRTALAAAMGLPDIDRARYILSSRHGELSRTATILRSLAGNDMPSPADFSMSVHHGLVGLLAIATGNRGGHSAVSAGPESFCYGLLEAAACTVEAPEEPAILLHCDERPEGAFAALFEEPEREGPMVAAICLRAEASGEGRAVAMRIEAREDAGSQRNHALDFLRFVAGGAARMESPGRRIAWEWSRA